MGKLKRNKCFIIGFIIALIVGIVFCLSKRTFNVDEPLSYALANAPGGWVIYEPNGWVQKSIFSNFAVMGKPFNYAQVYLNQVYDVHPPLYYYILHTVSSLKPGSFSVWYGLGINFISYIFNSCILYFFTKKISKNDILSLLVMLFFVLNSTIISEGLLFTRMYQLVSSFVLVMVIAIYHILIDDKCNKIWFVFLFCSILSGGLTHYYFYIILFLACIISTIYLLVKKEYKKLLMSAVLVLLAFGINCILFPAVFKHLFASGHGQKAISSISAHHLNIENLLGYVKNFVLGEWMFYVGILILIIAFVKGVRKNKTALLLSASFALSYYMYCFIVSQISNYITSRYIVPMSPVYLAFFAICLYEVFKSKHNIVAYSFLSFLIIINFQSAVKIIHNINTKPSWKFAEENQYKVAVVIIEDEYPTYCVNTVFADLRWYLATGITQLSHGFDNEIEKDFILYLQKELDLSITEEYLKRNVSEAISIKKVDNVITSFFNVYYVSVE